MAKHGVGVHLLLLAEQRVLLGRRRNTGFADGWWHVPGGRLEAGEALPSGAIREAREELGVEIVPEDLRFVHLNHHLDADGVARVGVFFEASRWSGEPINAEPEKCSELAWFPVDALPDRTVDYAVAGLRASRAGSCFGLHGW